MEFATGALGTLLPKLGELLMEEYNLQKSLKQGVKDLRDELFIMQAVLVKVSDVPLDQLDPLVKIWANDVRELSYDIEDSLDTFMVRVEGLDPYELQNFLGFIQKTCKKVTKLKLRRGVARDIKEVTIQVNDVIGNTCAATKIDPRLLALYNKASILVGIDEAIDELTKRLSKSNDVLQDVKTVSIVGIGGLGKTTLAKAIYENLKKNPDTKKVLRDILHELDKTGTRSSSRRWWRCSR